MDTDLIKLVNRLQDTFSNLGACHKSRSYSWAEGDIMSPRWRAGYAPTSRCTLSFTIRKKIAPDFHSGGQPVGG